ncbi:MAG: hypothetical protein HY682_09120 [Chloroflexi bacterium]|nr:hypothetical protein [Chloroflexota bacterium]
MPPPSATRRQARSIAPLLIYPALPSDFVFDQPVRVGVSVYYTSSPWQVDQQKIGSAIREAENWLANALGTRIKWEGLQTISSRHGIGDWRSTKIGLLHEEVTNARLPWTADHVYLAFVRGMGGYAGGIRYEAGQPGYAMVGDICLEAVCEFNGTTAGSHLLSDWPEKSYRRVAQTGAFIHEALHGLDLPHPDGWPEGQQPGWDETLMGHWWNMPDFVGTRGLTQREIERVLKWLA